MAKKAGSLVRAPPSVSLVQRTAERSSPVGYMENPYRTCIEPPPAYNCDVGRVNHQDDNAVSKPRKVGACSRAARRRSIETKTAQCHINRVGGTVT
jgi:hypothetical protein